MRPRLQEHSNMHINVLVMPNDAMKPAIAFT